MISYLKMTRLLVLLLCAMILSSCMQLRTEFYRNETEYLYEAGCAHYKQGDYDAAREALEELITLDPDYGPAYAVLGTLAMIDEQYEAAYKRFQQTIEHDPELEKDIQSFLALSIVHRERTPLVEAGVELAKLYPLLMAGRLDEIDALLTADIPLELLAKDSVTVTPGQLQDMRGQAAEIAGNPGLSVSLRLFLAYLLFQGEGDEQLVEDLLTGTIQDADGVQKQEAFILMGRLQEKRGNNAAAVENYLAAVRAGGAYEEVAHYLARIYQVDIDSILASQNGTHQSDTDSGMSSPVILAAPGNSSAERTIKRQKDEREFIFPRPQAVLIFSPQ